MKFKIGDRVKRVSDGLIQTVYDTDEIDHTIKVNWVDRMDKMHKQEHKVSDGANCPVVKTKC